jgi:hypothetical protein
MDNVPENSVGGNGQLSQAPVMGPPKPSWLGKMPWDALKDPSLPPDRRKRIERQLGSGNHRYEWLEPLEMLPTAEKLREGVSTLPQYWQREHAYKTIATDPSWEGSAWIGPALEVPPDIVAKRAEYEADKKLAMKFSEERSRRFFAEEEQARRIKLGLEAPPWMESLVKGMAGRNGKSDQQSIAPLVEVGASELAMAGDTTKELDYLPLLGLPGYLVRGWSHIIGAYPRVGKTELIRALCRNWLEIGETILYLSEEPRSIWEKRLARFPGPWNDHMRVVFGLGVGCAQLLERMKSGNESIVVVDTPRNLGILPENENDNAAVAAALNPWVAAARACNKTILFSLHTRKSGGEHGEGIAGAHALLAAVDVALEIHRDDVFNRRQIKGVARLIQPADLVYELTNDGEFTVLGDPAGVNFAEVRSKARQALDGEFGEWLTTAQVMEKLAEPKPAKELLRQALLAEARAGEVVRQPAWNENASGRIVKWRLWVPNI